MELIRGLIQSHLERVNNSPLTVNSVDTASKLEVMLHSLDRNICVSCECTLTDENRHDAMLCIACFIKKCEAEHDAQIDYHALPHVPVMMPRAQAPAPQKRKPKKSELRLEAVRAASGHFREQRLNPAGYSGEYVFSLLLRLLDHEPDLTCAEYVQRADWREIKRFCGAWRKYHK